MNRKKTMLALLCVLLAAAVVLAGCGGNGGNSGNSGNNTSGGNQTPGQGDSGEPQAAVDLLVYDYGQVGQPDSELYKQLVEAFNAGTDVNATLNYQYVPGDSYYPKLNAVMAANEAPDLFSAHAAGKLQPYVEAGKVLALDDYLNADPEWKSRFKEGIFDNVTFDGKVYGIPTQMNVVGLFYNESIFNQYQLSPPQTYDDLQHVIQVLNENKVTPIAFGAKAAWSVALFAEIITNRIGGNEPYDKVADGTGSWEDPAFIETGNIMQELIGMNAFSDGFLGLSYDEAIAQFQNGQAAMLVMGSWVMGSIAGEESKVKDDVRVVPFPTFAGGKGDPDTWLGQPDRSLIISQDAKDKDALIAFIKEWSTDEVQSQIAEKTGNLTVTKTELDAGKVLPLGVELSNLIQSMKQMAIFYDVGLGPKIGDEYNNTIIEILAGAAPEQAFSKLQRFTEDNR